MLIAGRNVFKVLKSVALSFEQSAISNPTLMDC